MQKPKNHDKDLVNIALPRIGWRTTVENYKNSLKREGYNNAQAVGSLGGAVSAGTIIIIKGVVCRAK